MDNIKTYQDYWRKLSKKLADKPTILQILPRRTLNTATSILENIKDIPFEKLSMSLYFYCQDLQMSEFTRYYEAQIELAGANPDKFVNQLHSFYNGISVKIKKQNLYSSFFELFYRCYRLRMEQQNKNVIDNVVIAYINLLTQNIEYLRPNKFDFNVTVVGLSTDGEILTDKDYFPNMDMPTYELTEYFDKNNFSFDVISKVYKKYGYNVRSPFDVEYLGKLDRIQSSTHMAMLPFINEYTFDVLQQVPFDSKITPFDKITCNFDLEKLKSLLGHRKRTLPTNGITIEFQNSNLFSSLLLKEILFDNKVFMLYRLSTSNGDLNGYFDTTGFFYTILFDCESEKPAAARNVATIILYCYACYVLNDPGITPQNFRQYFSFADTPNAEIAIYLHGGKLRNVYTEREERTGEARIGNDDFEKEMKAIQGFIRRLPEGQKASQDAIEFAESLGYELEPNETYVRPFIKQVFRLKSK